MGLSIRGNSTVYYYQDLETAVHFYVNLLGFAPVADYGYARTVQVASSSFLTLADAEHGRFRGDEPKTVTTALVTDELEAWYVYLTARGVAMERPFVPKEGSAHDGFVALDPEGYFLEFERFNRHPENNRLMPVLDGLPTHYTQAANAPSALGVKATVTWLYYEQLAAGSGFMEEILGLPQLVDQGFATVYRSSASGFLGPVQAGDGLHPFTPEKLVTPALYTDDLTGWLAHLRAADSRLQHSEPESAGSDLEWIALQDPAGYTIEFDELRDTTANDRLNQALRKAPKLYVNS